MLCRTCSRSPRVSARCDLLIRRRHLPHRRGRWQGFYRPEDRAWRSIGLRIRRAPSTADTPSRRRQRARRCVRNLHPGPLVSLREGAGRLISSKCLERRGPDETSVLWRATTRPRASPGRGSAEKFGPRFCRSLDDGEPAGSNPHHMIKSYYSWYKRYQYIEIYVRERSPPSLQIVAYRQ